MNKNIYADIRFSYGFSRCLPFPKTAVVPLLDLFSLSLNSHLSQLQNIRRDRVQQRIKEQEEAIWVTMLI